MARVILGPGTADEEGRTFTVPSLTLGDVIEALEERLGEAVARELSFYVNGTAADRLEGAATPVDDEDTVVAYR